MKRIATIALIMATIVAGTIFSHAEIGESALLSLLEEISDVPDEQITQYVGILNSYLKNDTTIQNLSDDIGVIYASIMSDGQRQKLTERGITPDDISEEVLLLKGWDEDSDYVTLIEAVADRDKETIKDILVKHSIVSAKEEAVAGGGLPIEEPIVPSITLFMDMEPVRSARFEDMGSHWARENVERLCSIGLVDGRSSEIFDPDSEITRAEYLTLLVRVLRLENMEITEDNPFGDIETGAWYEKSVLAARQLGLASGNADGTFAPGRRITRQEMAVMLANTLNYLEKKGKIEIDSSRGFAQTFNDMEAVSSWAYEAMARLNRMGLIMGDGGMIRPGGKATRAEAATVLMRLIESAKL
ncbi:MAG TPA: S-layer homology domain-containing protein [Clostridia bacterium]|nr:S-layer homology domain-containing protein [Clostridia bacterium]